MSQHDISAPQELILVDVIKAKIGSNHPNTLISMMNWHRHMVLWVDEMGQKGMSCM